MLGMPQAFLPSASQASESRPADKKASDPLGPSNRTMLGMAVPADAASAQSAQTAFSAGQAQSTAAQGDQGVWQAEQSFGDTGAPEVAKRASWVVPVLLLGLGLAVLGIIALAVLVFAPGEPEIAVVVVQTERGDALEVTVPSAPEGTRLRMRGSEQALQQQVATFPLSADGLVVGDNILELAIIEPSSSPETVAVTLTVSYRVRAGLARLSTHSPTLLVIVDALPGTKVQIDGETAELDERGHGQRVYPIDPESDTPVLDHAASYRLELPDGQVVEGEVKTRVPYATLQVEKPGPGLITDQQQVEIQGAVHEDAQVYVDGQEAPIEGGRFSYSHRLSDEGETRIKVLLRRQGRVSAARMLTVTRVADLAAEAAKFQPYAGLDYATIGADANAYRGRRVAFSGNVYHTDMQGGLAVAQMLVADCPRGQRCPLWVTHSGATEVSANMSVRVLGTVAGEQQFRSTSGQVRSVPRVDAVFLLPEGS